MAVSPVPSGQHSVTPHLVLRGAAKAIEFYKKAFGMTEVMRMPGPDGQSVMHAELKLGDSHIYLADEWPCGDVAAPEKFGGTTVSIHLYVPDCDAFYNQAVAPPAASRRCRWGRCSGATASARCSTRSAIPGRSRRISKTCRPTRWPSAAPRR